MGEINTNFEINHPSFLKYIGYSPVDFKNRSRPVIITECPSNGNLTDIFELE